MSICYACDNSLNVDGNVLRVSCVGLCGRQFHPSCAGLSKRSLTYFGEYTSRFVFYCDECKEISLDTILKAIKCNNITFSESMNNNNKKCRQISNELCKLDELTKSNDEIHCMLTELTRATNRNFNDLNKKVSELNDMCREIDQSKSILCNIKKDIISAIKNVNVDEPIINVIINLRDEINRFASEISSLIKSSESRHPAEVPHLTLVEEAVNNFTNFSVDLTIIRDDINGLAELVRACSNPIVHNQNVTSCNVSVHEELSCLLNTSKGTQTIDPDNEAIKKTHQSNETQKLPTNHEVIERFGETWTLPDWNRRIQKINSSNEATTTFFVKATSRELNNSAMAKLFNDLKIPIVKIETLNNRPLKLKLTIASKYAWIFTNQDNTPFTTKKFIFKKLFVDIKSKPKHKPKSKPNLKNNWSFKTNIFPDFSHFSTSKTKLNPVNQKKVSFRIPDSHKSSPPPTRTPEPSTHNQITANPPKPLRQQVSFNMDTSTPSSSTDPPNQTIPPSFPTFDLTSGAKYPNFVNGEIINASTALPRTNTSPYLDPLLPPTVKLTQQTLDSTDSRYALSRLREKKPMKTFESFWLIFTINRTRFAMKVRQIQA